MELIRIGTRGSALALTQANWVKRKIEERYPGIQIELIKIKTSGDRFLNTPIKAIGGKGLFVKEIEDALLTKKIDLAVHSMKDLPTEIPPGLTVAAITEREDARDALVTLAPGLLKDLPAGTKIGTGSLRRQAQILHFRPDLAVIAIRGNVDTRLKKLERREVGALIMAAAGLRRLGQESRITEYLSPDICLSAVAQGALGLEARENDPMLAVIAFFHHAGTATEVLAERAFLGRLGGGCHIPVGARAWADGGRVRLAGVVADPEGKRLFKGEIAGSSAETEQLGIQLAERLLEEGAEEILRLERDDRTEASSDPGPGNKREGRHENSHPLSGRRIVITRPRSQAGFFVRRIEELGGEVVEFPTIEILPPKSYEPLDRAIEKIRNYDWVVFTSVNGVQHFWARFQYLGRDFADLADVRIAAIGPETAKKLREIQLDPHLVPSEYRAEAILQEMSPSEVRHKRILLPRAAKARDILPDTLREWEAEVDVVAAYRTVPAAGDKAGLQKLLMKGEIDIVTFTSSSTVTHFAAQFKGEDIAKLLGGTVVACIGPVTQKTAQELGIAVEVIPDEYTVPGLTQAIVNYFLKQKGGDTKGQGTV